MIKIETTESNNISSKLDAAIGLLTNVPQDILNRINKKFFNGEETNKIEVTILYRDTPQKLTELAKELEGEFQDLGFNFGIMNLPLKSLPKLATSNSIQYIELPKNLYEADSEGNRATCVPQAVSTYNLSGKGVLVGFIDSGIAYTHPAFMDSDGNTRIEYIYDLSLGRKVYDKETINKAIKSNDPYSIVPVLDNTGHGTHVAGIACAGGKINSVYKGAAPEASIAMVKAARGSWILSSQIMQGIKFLIDKSKEINMPLVINMSLSTNNGAHNGSSLLEQYISTVSNLERATIVIAAGNEGDAAHHTGGELDQTQTKAFNVASDESTVVINLYKSILPDVSLNIISPTGQSSGNINIQEGYFHGGIGRDRYDIYVSGPKPFELNSEIQIIISSISSEYLIEGVWKLQITTLNNYKGSFSIWLPISEGLNPKTKFLEPINYNTLGIPATVDNIIAVGSYNSLTNTLSSFSGRGPQIQSNIIRPDLVAPGVGILGPIPNGGYDSKTGTSMAAPQVAGICALIMQFGIVNGNDPYLFGQRLKYYLVRGANRARTDIEYPNPLWGYGTACAYDSLYDIENTLNQILARNYRLRDIGGEVFQEKSIPLEKVGIRNLEEELRKKNINSDDLISIIVGYTNKDELNKINDVPNASAIAISDAYAIAIFPLNELNLIEPYIYDIVKILIPPLYTLTALSPIQASGAPLFTNNPYLKLDGTGVLVGIVDTGIDYLNEEFMLEDDTTRIISIWDQTIGRNDVLGIKFGTEYTEEQINQAINLNKQGGDPYSIVPSKDEVGHGTMTAGIIGGRGRNPDLLGAAPNCKFAIVKLAQLSKSVLEYSGVDPNKTEVYGSAEIMLATRYLANIALRENMPLILYVPVGTNTGGHDGTNEVEGSLDTFGRRPGVVPVVGTGNQGDTQTHIEGKIEQAGDFKTIEVKIGKNQKDLNFSIYCSKPDRVSVSITSPSGEMLNRVDTKLNFIKDYKFVYEGTIVDLYYSIPDQLTGDELITLKFRNIKDGTWQIRLYGDKIIDGRYWSWLPQRQLLDPDTRFFNPVETTTLVIPATTSGAVVSAYYNQGFNTTVSGSGRGYTRDGRIKPDVAAGGVNAIVTKPGGGTTVATGSSVASSVLAGCCALILQWAIIEKNDVEISTKKLISYIIAGTKMRKGDVYPNMEWGYGMLDMQGIFNSLRKYKNKSEKYIKYDEIDQYINSEKNNEFYVDNLFIRLPNK
ncbi:peptidase S8 [Clostridium botulinum]|uniref:S8 family peptidase n=1 Tax=Clostridium botulinum TaxID=1491 RepID=UPI0006937305|nr:S8 family peptidase [Clostridium botulinum]MBY6935131.1 S8 family peptidase [Clostridium botulinum]NFL84250.1 peptidase S8 [Clostridium botulinum]NFN12333.1 peptidase S8 [Clostridium botulinum]NFO37444.1 peptidase S8 [Clostridium botulinum]NFO44155.1 peptidase S8 [Clostridium botulinum]